MPWSSAPTLFASVSSNLGEGVGAAPWPVATSARVAKKIVATDPVIVKGEMVADYHRYFGSAALMLVPETHERVARKAM